MDHFERLRAVNRRNLLVLRTDPFAEISGALGDLGTFLPIMLALSLRGAIDLPATLVASGLFNIATGMIFGVPLPVQPMKAIAAATLSTPNSPHSHTATLTAGLLVSLTLLLLTSSNLLTRLARAVPPAVIKGIQLGAGLSLILSASNLILPAPLTAALFLAPLVFALRSPRFPYALFAFIAGLAVVVATGNVRAPRWDPWVPRWAVPVWSREAASAAVAQVPLTVLNSVVAVEALARELLPEAVEYGPGVAGLGLSVGVMNVVGVWVRAMPVCHGAGGLAAQWRFGARSGASVVMLGVVKVVVGLVFGESLAGVLRAFPGAGLGVMLVAAGVELARVGVGVGNRRGRGRGSGGLSDGEWDESEAMMVVLMTAAGMLVMKNAAIGFAVGLACHWSYGFGDWLENRWHRGRDEGERRGLLW